MLFRINRTGTSNTRRRALLVLDRGAALLEAPRRRREPRHEVNQLARAVPEDQPGPPRGLAKFQTFANFCKLLAGSFSAVSEQNFPRKYAFDSIFQALQDLHPFAPLQSQNFRKQKIGLKKQQFS